jgi:hypothetical protein
VSNALAVTRKWIDGKWTEVGRWNRWPDPAPKTSRIVDARDALLRGASPLRARFDRPVDPSCGGITPSFPAPGRLHDFTITD